MVFLTSLLPASCHKSVPVQKTAPPAVVAAGTNSADRYLGEISLTNHNETSFRLKSGENCTLTPKLLDSHNLQITLAIETKNDYGETHDFSVTQVVGQPGKPFEVAVDDIKVCFTPRLVEQR